MEETYIVLEKETVRELVREVNRLKIDGWQIIGGMNNYIKDHDVSSYSGNLDRFKPKNIFYQTMERQKVH